MSYALFVSASTTFWQDAFSKADVRAIKLGRKPLMQQGAPKRNPESKAALESNQKLAILEFARISKSQVFPSLIAVRLMCPRLGKRIVSRRGAELDGELLLPIARIFVASVK